MNERNYFANGVNPSLIDRAAGIQSGPQEALNAKIAQTQQGSNAATQRPPSLTTLADGLIDRASVLHAKLHELDAIASRLLMDRSNKVPQGEKGTDPTKPQTVEARLADASGSFAGVEARLCRIISRLSDGI